jgi:hypothetical protein
VAELDVPTMKRMSYAERIRAQMGLRHDLAYIQELAEQTDLDTTVLGTPVTHEEFADLQARQVLVGYVPAVEAHLRGAANYAGIWFDQIPGGGVCIALTGKPTVQQTAAVGGLLPTGAQVTYVNARYTRAELDALYEKIEEGTTFDVRQAKPVISGVSVSGRHNVVEVMVRSKHDRAAFLRRFGVDPRIEIKIREHGPTG